MPTNCTALLLVALMCVKRKGVLWQLFGHARALSCGNLRGLASLPKALDCPPVLFGAFREDATNNLKVVL